MCEGIVAAVLRRAGGRPVQRVRVRAGVLLRIVEPSLQQAFTLLADGTPAEGATVELTQVPAELSCHGCGYQGNTRDALAVCPTCGGADVALAGGDELVLESVTLRAPSTDPTASARG
jgi:hydrogenase nickel incorporation protein HypA/HybF